MFAKLIEQDTTLNNNEIVFSHFILKRFIGPKFSVDVDDVGCSKMLAS